MPLRIPRLSLVALAIGAVVVMSGCTTVSTLWQAAQLSTQPVPSATSASSPPTGLVSLAVGDCVNRTALEDEAESTDPFAACSAAHDLEVYASTTLPDGDYPSVEALTNQGSTECAKEFGTFIGLDFGISDLDFIYYYPTESSWANGDRGIDCLVYDPAGKTTGSLKGATR